jgi:uncharacterized protein YbjT (DUF2867 family)
MGLRSAATMEGSERMNLMLLGATGLVGGHVLDLALADPRVTSVTAPTRRPLPPRPGLTAPQIDFDHLPDDPAFWVADAIICALGTTLKVAGSRERFYRIDHDYPVEIGRRAHEVGTGTFILNSAMGADPKSLFFYNRVKGQTEADIVAIGFERTVLVRPGLIDGPRPEPRPLEEWSGKVLRALKPVLPRSLQVNRPAVIASRMLESAFAASKGVTVVASDELV